MIASLLATSLLMVAFPQYDSGQSIVPKMITLDIGKNSSYFQAFLMEIVLTFMLTYVIFATVFGARKFTISGSNDLSGHQE